MRGHSWCLGGNHLIGGSGRRFSSTSSNASTKPPPEPLERRPSLLPTFELSTGQGRLQALRAAALMVVSIFVASIQVACGPDTEATATAEAVQKRIELMMNPPPAPPQMSQTDSRNAISEWQVLDLEADKFYEYCKERREHEAKMKWTHNTCKDGYIGQDGRVSVKDWLKQTIVFCTRYGAFQSPEHMRPDAYRWIETSLCDASTDGRNKGGRMSFIVSNYPGLRILEYREYYKHWEDEYYGEGNYTGTPKFQEWREYKQDGF